MGLGVLVSPHVNQRRTEQIVFQKGKEDLTMKLLNGSDESDHMWLQNGIIVVLPYVLAKDPNPYAPTKTHLDHLNSTASVSWQYPENETRGQVGLIVKGAAVGRPTNRVFTGLAGFFGYHLDDNRHFKIGTTDDKIDMEMLMEKILRTPISSIADLNRLLDSLCFHFRYKQEDIDPNDDDAKSRFSYAIRHFSAFFRMITPLRLAVIEGGHRSFLLNRVIQGYTHTTTVPLPAPWNKPSHATLPSTGTLVARITIRFIYLHDNKARDEHYAMTGIDDNYTPKDLETCRDYSKRTQDFKEEVFIDDYSQILGETLKQITTFFDNDKTYFLTDKRNNCTEIRRRALAEDSGTSMNSSLTSFSGRNRAVCHTQRTTCSENTTMHLDSSSKMTREICCPRSLEERKLSRLPTQAQWKTLMTTNTTGMTTLSSQTDCQTKANSTFTWASGL